MSSYTEISRHVSALAAECNAYENLAEISKPLNQIFKILSREKLKRRCSWMPMCTNMDNDDMKKYNISISFNNNNIYDKCKVYIEKTKPPEDIWLLQTFDVYVEQIYGLISCADTEKIKFGICSLMRILQHEGDLRRERGSGFLERFPLYIFQTFLCKILNAKYLTEDELHFFISEYVRKYCDIRYYFLVVMRKILTEHKKQSSDSVKFEINKTNVAVNVCNKENITGDNSSDNPSTSNDSNSDSSSSSKDSKNNEGSSISDSTTSKWYTWQLSEEELSRRILFSLIKAPRPDNKNDIGKRKHDDMNTDDDDGCGNSDDDSDDSDASDNVGDDSGGYAVLNKPFFIGIKCTNIYSYRAYRGVYQQAWSLYMSGVRMTMEIKKKLLEVLPSTLLLYTSNPLALADLFLDAFSKECDITSSVLALSGILQLFVKHRLGDPDALAGFEENENSDDYPYATPSSAKIKFYNRLYTLLTPAALSPKLRVRFLRLLNLSLNSPMLPTTMLVFFLKKCVRLACLTSPSCSISLLCIVKSLLQKNASICRALIDVPYNVGVHMVSDGDSFNFSSLPYGIDTENNGKNKQKCVDDLEQNEKNKNQNELLNAICISEADTQISINALPPQVHNAKLFMWEIEFLKEIITNPVSEFAKTIDDVLYIHPKNNNLDDIFNISCVTLAEKYIKQAVHTVAPKVANLYRSIPKDVCKLDDALQNIAKKIKM